jgi:hypothetical protein
METRPCQGSRKTSHLEDHPRRAPTARCCLRSFCRSGVYRSRRSRGQGKPRNRTSVAHWLRFARKQAHRSDLRRRDVWGLQPRQLGIDGRRTKWTGTSSSGAVRRPRARCWPMQRVRLPQAFAWTGWTSVAMGRWHIPSSLRSQLRYDAHRRHDSDARGTSSLATYHGEVSRPPPHGRPDTPQRSPAGRRADDERATRRRPRA